MSTIQCPICEANAHETLPRSGDFHEITCLTCGHFRITEAAVAQYEDSPVDERKRLLSKAKANASGDALPIVGAH
ncbi:hypothetical protein U0C82_09900 [Fulvimarina sp. 2208YS6-2-32]|uniref:Uncharacterized protein n=1 Tax=Fulvimarina uroteuthidis TaxID=3098149 RepID=A0ABU5I2I9_9HYPH|nr:hypothetical protein [Fulvimarina sp. 2208YS6-2-32]MDY8109451.1 hypothetical protein [Fulvimarina sp. 2208YS6-2-32]